MRPETTLDGPLRVPNSGRAVYRTRVAGLKFNAFHPSRAAAGGVSRTLRLPNTSGL
jgi:hypothetical protein